MGDSGVPTEERRVTDFRFELRALLNRYSMEGPSDTPDYVLMQYLMDCLEAYEAAVQRRQIAAARTNVPDPPAVGKIEATPPQTPVEE